jgi:hypothetical protein
MKLLNANGLDQECCCIHAPLMPCCCYRESIASRLPFIALMILGKIPVQQALCLCLLCHLLYRFVSTTCTCSEAHSCGMNMGWLNNQYNQFQ